MASVTRQEVVSGVAVEVCWWVGERRRKLLELRHESAAVNPFLIPLVASMHGFVDFERLAEFLLGGHLLQGHSTGFGKLLDEKICPNVFGTRKLDRAFRRSTNPYGLASFDDIDHVVHRPGLREELLSLKSGRWTIQLSQAVGLNRSFSTLIDLRTQGLCSFEKIVVGVFYGKKEDLTDKFRIIRGINTGAKHDVADITGDVEVLSGREFWAWLNGDEPNTQEWVMDGILEGYAKAEHEHGPLSDLIDQFKDSFSSSFESFVTPGGVDWHGILAKVNG